MSSTKRDRTKVFMELVCRFRSLATAKKLNIVTALETEGDRPESNANPQRVSTISMDLI